MSTQQDNLSRVANKISTKVLAFVRERGIGGTFHASDLYDYVGDHVAPASADRILRHLRLESEIDYVILNRSRSYYRVTYC